MKQLRFFTFASLLACLVSWANVAQAQQEGHSEANTASQRLIEDYGLSALDRLPIPSLANPQNLAKLVQLGNSNKAKADQYNPGTEVNQAYIVQVGSFNTASLTQNGSGNTTIINQKGDDNKATSNVNGNNNVVDLNQIGNRNRIVRDVATDGREVFILQKGDDLRINQTSTQATAPPRYSIEMIGTSMQISIETGRIGQ
ncbi:hypothetical protein [Hymenobacter aerophilus]|uniref:hypothetical protein n=1 Tax=Hymenobacter aerophilus TaxID=119644 RepID=UPI00035FB01A|nr:hypothetical protein [Hymenobacter aerophilus]